MSTVTLTIGPKSYAVACADGEEPHIAALGAMIAEKYARLGASRAPLEAQNILFAALFMADELAEARKQLAACPPERIAGLEAQIAELQTSRTGADAHISDLQQKLDDAIATAAQAELRAADQAKAQAAAQAAARSAEAEAANAMVTRLELLATRAEAAADALEAGADSA